MHGLLSSCLAQASHCGGLSCGARVLGRVALKLQHVGARAQAQLLQGMWNRPEPRIEPCPLHWQGDS